MADWKQDRIGSAERAKNPTVLARMRSGFAVIADTQFLPGYCLLLASPHVEHLSDLPFAQRSMYLQDMSLLREAIMRDCRPLCVNDEILGNYDRYLHARLFPAMTGNPANASGILSGSILMRSAQSGSMRAMVRPDLSAREGVSPDGGGRVGNIRRWRPQVLRPCLPEVRTHLAGDRGQGCRERRVAGSAA
jgi:diadenosine tetraphosphate (Ap4A) HIT family hydrolase